MPLVRVEVRNEYGLGMPELYKDVNKEDPKALLDGVAVAGLVGILRQLGDLAEFAAEVFHGLQEQVMTTSSRSHKLMVRAQKIEVAISPLEKAILAQRSHLHYAYTTGSHWHAHIQSERNHFIYSDLPLFIMDSYEECRGPPRLQSLDKFDTGGPGSCLKRYSDPSFFKRASAGIVEAYAGKAPRDRKARKRQKKRTRIKNGDIPQCVSHGIPVSNHSGRMNYASQNFDVQTSPSQDVSKYDAALEFEMGNDPNSFDSRVVSGYGESISSPGYTMKFNGCEPEEISSQLTMNHSDILDTSSLDEQSRALDEDVQDQTGARLASVTWDEKTEILEPTGCYPREETMEIHPTDFDPIPLEVEAAICRTDDCDNESTPKSAPIANQLDEVESETDNYMDALNTIESESETDLECQTKQEVDQFSASNIKPVDEITNRLNSEDTGSHLSNFKSHVLANISGDTAIFEDNNIIGLESNHISSKETSVAEPSSVPSECYAEIQSPRLTGKSSVIDSLPSIDLVETDDINSPNTEVLKNLTSLNSSGPVIEASKADTVLSSSVESQKSRLPSGVTGVNFWTNGGLLGLQPSKPPDFSALDCGNDDSVVLSSRSNIPEGQENSLKPNISNNSIMAIQDPSPKFTTLFHNDQEDSISIMKTSLRSSQAHSNGKHERTANLHHNISSNQSHNLVLPKRSTKVPETKKYDDLDVKAAKLSDYNCNSSSRMFELSNKLLTNGQGKVSYFDNDAVSSFRTDISEQKGASHQNLSGRTFIEQFGSGSPFISPSSSPPLEHMNISFQPIDGFEISKLKLKFPNGNEGHESSRDVFPSFQLVPEETTSLQDLGLDSNDDTFSESSPHMSDYYLSHYSESDSEEWETRESPKCNDDDIYDALRRNSTSESVSSNLDVGRIGYGGIMTNVHGLENPFSESGLGHSQTDLPIFDTLNASFREDLSNDSETKYQLDSDFPKDPMPQPPLPPVEWRAMKPNPDMATEKQVPPFEALIHAFDQKFPTSTVTHQPKPAPVRHLSIEAVACTTDSRHPNEQNYHGQKAVNHRSDSKVTDEKGDFLQQIRTKSFSLRRGITDRSILAPGAPANASVTAILEKANAIRQAVGSDDGEDDDSWD